MVNCINQVLTPVFAEGLQVVHRERRGTGSTGHFLRRIFAGAIKAGDLMGQIKLSYMEPQCLDINKMLISYEDFSTGFQTTATNALSEMKTLSIFKICAFALF